MQRILISLEGDSWHAEFLDNSDYAAMGMSKVPTPWTGMMDGDEVVARIQALNPYCEVRLKIKEHWQ